VSKIETFPGAIAGQANGVPYVALPPGGERKSVPVVVAWHLQDPPRTEAAFAAALPLRGLEAWRLYLGLPLSGSRLPAGGADEVMRLGQEDAVLNLQKPVAYGAFEEFGPALAELRAKLDLDTTAPLGVMGGSIGAAIAELVLAESDLEIGAAVLISPVVQLRRAVEATGRQLGITYEWRDESNAVADRLDFVKRSGEIAQPNRPAVLLVVGEQDDDAGFREPAAELAAALKRHYASESRVELVTVADMGHAFAEEPGVDPAPQTAQAAVVERHAVEWFRRHLLDRLGVPAPVSGSKKRSDSLRKAIVFAEMSLR
jgi:dienelactone hydrolase